MRLRIAVTGHRGYIGSALWHELKPGNYRIRGFDWPEDNICSGATQRAIEIFRPHLIYNLAAISGEKQCRINPLQTLATNVTAACRLRADNPDAMFIQASSASVLGDLGEKKTPYANSKKLAEESLVKIKGTGALFILRFGTVVGYNKYGVTRFDTPANQMIETGVQMHQITVHGPNLYRPWVCLDFVIKYLNGFALNFDLRQKEKYHILRSLAQANYTLKEMANLIASAIVLTGGSQPAIRIFRAGKDSRDYTAPVMGTEGFGAAILGLARDV